MRYVYVELPKKMPVFQSGFTILHPHQHLVLLVPFIVVIPLGCGLINSGFQFAFSSYYQ